MPIFVPTDSIDLKDQDFFERYVTVGELYNLDADSKVLFQFNKDEFEESRSINWAQISSVGANSNQFQYINRGSRQFELPLLFIADKGMPPVKIDGFMSPFVTSEDLTVDIDVLYQELDSWTEELPSLGRPSFIKIFICSMEYTGFIKELRRRVLDSFEDGSTRRALITIQFQEWEEAL
jgi:hypothetical protein